MAVLIDTHAHLDAEQFADDLPAVLGTRPRRRRRPNRDRGDDGRVERRLHRLSPPTSAISSPRSASIPITPPKPRRPPGTRSSRWPHDKEVVGIGETGLDRHWNDTPFPQQEDYFARHLELSRRVNKPIVIHCREAEADVLRMLRADFDRTARSAA